MATEQTLRYLVEANDRDLKTLQKSVRDTNKLIGKDTADAAAIGSKGFDGFGGKAQLLAGGALVALGAGAKEAASRASDLGEQVNKATAVFGPSSKEIVEWSKTTARGLGISRVAALEATGTFGNMLIPMGIGKKRAAEMSRTMVGLAADMASFNNASPEETLAAISSGLAGETEPLRRFGVFLNADRIAAQALAMGLGKAKKGTEEDAKARIKASSALIAEEKARRALEDAIKKHGKGSLEARAAQVALDKAQLDVKSSARGAASDLTASAKAQASYALIMADMKKSGSVGDFAKTSTSLANAQRIQKAVQDDLIVSTGQGLLPIQQTLNQIIGKATGLLFQHQTAGKAVVAVVALLAAGVFAVNGALKAYQAAQTVATVAAKLFGKEGKATTLAVKAWAVAQRLLNLSIMGFPLVWIIAALVAVGVGLVALYKKSETFRNIVNGAWGVVKDGAAAMKRVIVDDVAPKVRTAIDWISTAGGKVKTAFLWLKDNTGTALGVLKQGVELYLTPFRVAIDLIGEGLGKIRAVLRWLRDNAGNLLKKLEPLTNLLGKVGGFLGKIPGIGDVAAGFNSAAAKAARSKMAPTGASGGGLASQTRGLLQTIDRLFGGAVMTSGYRSPAHNAAVGGAPNSDHLTGRAFDLVPAGGWTAATIAHFDRIVSWLAGHPLVRWIGWRGVAGHGPYDHLHVSTFGDGGIVTGRTLGLIGERGSSNPEAVLPLGSARGRRLLAEAFAGALGGGAGGVNVNVGTMVVRSDDDAMAVGSSVWRALAVR